MIRILFLLFAVILPSSVLASEGRIFLNTFPIPLMVESKKQGVFISLVNEIAKRSSLDIDISVSPPKRAINQFLKKKVDGLFPALDVNFPPGIEIVRSSESIYIKEDFVFTSKKKPLLSTILDLEGKVVGITRGYPYVRELIHNNLIKLDLSNTDEMGAKKLIAGRTQAFVVEEYSGLKAFSKTNLSDQVQYDPSQPLSRQDVYFAFQNTDKGRAIERKISKAIASMKKDGTFQKIIQSAKKK